MYKIRFGPLIHERNQPRRRHQIRRHLREKIRDLNIIHERRRLPVSARFGVPVETEADTSIDTLITKADRALYTAKANGKNQVALTPEQ